MLDCILSAGIIPAVFCFAVMEKKIKVLGVVGARSGSKSIPHKNIKPLGGKPLMAWIIEAAKNSSLVDRVVISTDSQEYADIAKQHGAEAPFLRPEELARDSEPDFTYLYHAANWFKENEGWQADIILRLPPTTPLCCPDHIDGCIKLLMEDPDADSARTVVPASKHPYKLWRDNNGYIEPFLSEEYTGLKDAHNMPRQSFPQAFQHVDVIALRWKTLIEEKSMAGKKVRFYAIPKDRGIDIDTEIDFALAELLLAKQIKQRDE